MIFSYSPSVLLFALIVLFIFSFLSNVTPFAGASYTLAAVYILNKFGLTGLNLATVILITGIGATVAKPFIYAGAFGFRSKLLQNKNIKLFARWIGQRPFYVALFITAFIPALPLDDYVYIGVGAHGANPLPIFGTTLAAKIAKSAFEIPIELLLVKSVLSPVVGLGIGTTTIALSVAFVVIGYITYKIDWEALYVRILSSHHA